jgi:hypothetical protein
MHVHAMLPLVGTGHLHSAVNLYSPDDVDAVGRTQEGSGTAELAGPANTSWMERRVAHTRLGELEAVRPGQVAPSRVVRETQSTDLRTAAACARMERALSSVSVQP